MSPTVKTILERVATWPERDQEELADVAREIEERRTGVYVLNEDERAAIDEARRSPIVPVDEVSSFWKRHGAK